MTQQILSRTRLRTIVDKLHLYGEEQDAATEDARINHMSKDISVEQVHDTRNNNISAFTISYTAADPKIAQAVTTEVADLFIEVTLKERHNESEGTTKFISDQLEQARERLAEQEAKVKAFEGVHEGVLPSQQTSNLTILGGLQSQLQNEQDSLNQSKQQRVYLQALIDENRAARGGLRPDGTPTGLVEIDQQLDRLRAQLVDLSSRYTDQYPDVLKLKGQIAKTQKLRDELAASPRKVSESTSTARDAEGAGATSALAQLQGQLKANQAEIANREQRIAELQQRIDGYQARLNEAPSTEQQLDEVTRGYEQSKAIYDDLLKKKNASEMATSMEHLQQGEHFTVLDPPSLPVKPDFPNRLKFCGIGLALGLVVGAIVVAGFEFADDRLHSDTDLKAILPMAILSEIPEVTRPSDEARSKRQLALRWVITVVAVAAILAGTTISILQS